MNDGSGHEKHCVWFIREDGTLCIVAGYAEPVLINGKAATRLDLEEAGACYMRMFPGKSRVGEEFARWLITAWPQMKAAGLQ